jgi:hypothetical protein
VPTAVAQMEMGITIGGVEEAWLFGWGPQWAPEGQPNKPKQTEISGRGGATSGHSQQANGSKKCN